MISSYSTGVNPSVVLMALFISFGIRAARDLTPKALFLTLLLLIAAGPVGWVLALLDSRGPDVVNSAGSANAFIAMFLPVAVPLLTIVGVVAALAEISRSALDLPR